MIIVRDAYKSFNGNQVLKGLNLEILEGEMFALIGRSGLGEKRSAQAHHRDYEA